MRSRIWILAISTALAWAGSAQAQFPVPSDEESWKAYQHVKSVLATMPGPMRRAHNFDFRDFCDVSSDPDFLAWASMSSWERLQKQHEMETTRAITKPIRESQGYILYHHRGFRSGVLQSVPAGDRFSILLNP
ncbi:hypothetical protein K2X85_09090 [bacterium]|nr:hypothetical protein [bacterium]